MSNKVEQTYLIMFYGTECHFCHEMMPLVERLEREEGVKVERLEVWHNSENAKMMEEVDKGGCGGVPFFYNKKSGLTICGATDYESLKKWALSG